MTSKDFFKEVKLEWCASEQQDKPLLNDMMKFAKLYHKEQLILSGVSNSFNLEIKDRDIATIEAMHDTLLDEKVLGLNARSMKESRALTQRMYKALSKD